VLRKKEENRVCSKSGERRAGKTKTKKKKRGFLYSEFYVKDKGERGKCQRQKTFK